MKALFKSSPLHILAFVFQDQPARVCCLQVAVQGPYTLRSFALRRLRLFWSLGFLWSLCLLRALGLLRGLSLLRCLSLLRALRALSCLKTPSSLRIAQSGQPNGMAKRRLRRIRFGQHTACKC
jgi:hypothetical protein